MVRAGGVGYLSAPSSQLYCKPKTALQSLFFFKCMENVHTSFSGVAPSEEGERANGVRTGVYQ